MHALELNSFGKTTHNKNNGVWNYSEREGRPQCPKEANHQHKTERQLRDERLATFRIPRLQQNCRLEKRQKIREDIR